ncbi:MAG: DUF1700 domain-containing protein [Clostridiales bacterium]|nr:DUF1700 domain-containing protein [Clostridiales bacterium]
MSKNEFLSALSGKLATLPQSEIQKSLEFYRESIEERMEEGMSESDAVASLEDLDIIAERIIYETPLPVLMKERMKPKGGMTAGIVVLLILGFPVWFPLLLAFGISISAIYIAIWSIIISLYMVVICLGIAGVLGIIGCIPAFMSSPVAGFLSLGTGFLCIGLCIIAFFGVTAASKGLIGLTKVFARGLKGLFIKN